MVDKTIYIGKPLSSGGAAIASELSVVDAGDYYTGDNAEDILQEIGVALESAGATIPDVLFFDTVAAMKASTSLAIGKKAITFGYYTAGDDGGGEYVIVAAATGTDDGGKFHDLTGITGQAELIVGMYANVKNWGAKGDGVADDSIAFENCVKFIVSEAGFTTEGSNRTLRRTIFIPAATVEYRIATPKKLIPEIDANRKVGLSFLGAGVGTTLHFDYDGDDYMCYNTDEFLFVKFEDMRFTCDSILSKFMYSSSSGGTQAISFDNVIWEGAWQKIFVLRGSNNNSEWRWNNCAISITCADVMMDLAESDQFLNYWFYATKLYLYDGQCIRASAGGHFKFFFCDWSGLNPTMTYNQSINGAPLFEFTGRTHARGVCSLIISGGRFEHKNDLSKFIYSEWNQGNIYVNADFNSNLYTGSVDHAVFDAGNTAGASVKFDSCQLQGIHRYKVGTEAFKNDKAAVYENCQFIGDSINDHIISEYTSNSGGRYPISINNCNTNVVGAWNYQTVMDADIGGFESAHLKTGERHFIFRNATGKGNPSTTQPMYVNMPENAVITKVLFFNDGSLTSGYEVTYSLKDGLGNVIDSITGTLGNAWNQETRMAYQLDNTKNQLYLETTTGTSDQFSSKVFCMISYIGG